MHRVVTRQPTRSRR